MAVRGINLKSLIFAALAAAYLMYFVDKWFAGTLGLFGSFPGTSSTWWMIEHHIDGILIALAFAWPFVYRKLPGAGWLKGTIFGIIWTIGVFVVSLIAGALGATMFQQMPTTAAAAISTFILHIAWGFLLGVLYNPPESVRMEEMGPQTA